VLSPKPTAAQIPPAAPASARTEPAKAPAKTAEAPKPEPAKAEPPRATLPPATLVFAVQPWGEIFVNGRSRGVTPPMKSLKLDPGKYKIEVRNTSFTPHVENLDLKARDEVTVRYKFQ
jgi:serine/threonine-protein kinase